MTGAPSTPRPDSLALAQAATAVAAGRPVLEVALELAGAARQLDELLDRLDDCARFAATIDGAELEASSTRLLVTVRTHPDADPEQLRTDRTDGAWGEIMAGRVRRNIGRRVLVWKQLEEAGPDKKVRVLVWMDVLDEPDTNETPPPTPDPAPSPPQPTGAPADTTPSGARSERDQLADQVRAAIADAGIPDGHLAALLAARFDGAPSIDHLDDGRLRWLAQRTATPSGVQTLRTAAAADHQATQGPACVTCGAPSDALDDAGECPTCTVPF